LIVKNKLTLFLRLETPNFQHW